MKITAFVTAALVAATGVVGVAPAAAQRVVVHERTVVRHESGYRHHTRRVCDVRHRHGHRVRVCRTVRY